MRREPSRCTHPTWTENDADKLAPSVFNKAQSPEKMLQAVLEKAIALSTA